MDSRGIHLTVETLSRRPSPHHPKAKSGRATQSSPQDLTLLEEYRLQRWSRNWANIVVMLIAVFTFLAIAANIAFVWPQAVRLLRSKDLAGGRQAHGQSPSYCSAFGLRSPSQPHIGFYWLRMRLAWSPQS